MTLDPDRHRRLLELIDDALDQADIRLTVAARTRLRFALTDIADADHLHLTRHDTAADRKSSPGAHRGHLEMDSLGRARSGARSRGVGPS